MNHPHRRRVLLSAPLCLALLVASLTFIDGAEETPVVSQPAEITIDGQFDDWKEITSYSDPADDTHDTDGDTAEYVPEPVIHPDTDLLEYKLCHDAENLYIYARAAGKIGNTLHDPDPDPKKGGRYYITVAIDSDNNDNTGYWLHGGGYHPTSGGYDVNAEIEWFDGEFNSAPYMNKCCVTEKEKYESFYEQSQKKYQRDSDGPYPAGFMTLRPGVYDHYTQWVYHEDGTITFVVDRGPVVHGIIEGKLSPDEHELEMKIPFRGFLVDQNNEPIIRLGDLIDVSISLEASGELSPDGKWASDTGEPIEHYLLSRP